MNSLTKVTDFVFNLLCGKRDVNVTRLSHDVTEKISLLISKVEHPHSGLLGDIRRLPLSRGWGCYMKPHFFEDCNILF